MESPLKTKSVSSLAVAFVVSCLGFLACVAFVVLLWQHHGWIETERAHPTANPVFYAAALEMVHYACFLMLPFLGFVFIVTCLLMWKHHRDSVR